MIGFILGIVLGVLLALQFSSCNKEDFLRLPDHVKKWIIERIKK